MVQVVDSFDDHESNENARNYRRINAELAREHANALQALHNLENRVRQQDLEIHQLKQSELEKTHRLKQLEQKYHRSQQYEMKYHRLKQLFDEDEEPIVEYSHDNQLTKDKNVSEGTFVMRASPVDEENSTRESIAAHEPIVNTQAVSTSLNPLNRITDQGQFLNNISERAEEEELQSQEEVAEEVVNHYEEENVGEAYDSLMPAEVSDVETLVPESAFLTPSIIHQLPPTRISRSLSRVSPLNASVHDADMNQTPKNVHRNIERPKNVPIEEPLLQVTPLKAPIFDSPALYNSTPKIGCSIPLKQLDDLIISPTVEKPIKATTKRKRKVTKSQQENDKEPTNAISQPTGLKTNTARSKKIKIVVESEPSRPGEEKNSAPRPYNLRRR